MRRKIITLPMYDPQKANLPKRSNYIGSMAWLRAVQEAVGKPIIFALDQAFMCQGNFGGRSDEFVIWIYGDTCLEKYNGIVVLDNEINSSCVEWKNGVLFTNFERTVLDAFAYESFLDMQGITEALNKYYYTNGESFSGLSLPEEYQERFNKIANEAVEYHNS